MRDMRQITVTYHCDDGMWWADSSDLPGFSAAADTLDQLRDEVRAGVAFAIDDAPHMILETTATWKSPGDERTQIGWSLPRPNIQVAIGYDPRRTPSSRPTTNARLALV